MYLSRPYRGFTLIEVVVVMALLGVIVMTGLLVDMQAYRSSGFRSDRELLVTLLARARSQAINNICTASDCTDGVPHGVHIEPGRFVLFEGATYDADDLGNADFAQDSASTSADVIFSLFTCHHNFFPDY
jgi:prepilin-type N-terminal cleavage/methylation domain-containing protein